MYLESTLKDKLKAHLVIKVLAEQGHIHFKFLLVLM